MNDAKFDGRRVFLKKLAATTAAAAGVLLVYRQPVLAALQAAHGEGGAEHEAPQHEYAFVVDINRCIGCGYCVKACSNENNVPEGQFRTWVERYVIAGNGIYIDAPDGGMNGFEEVDEAFRQNVRSAFFVPKLCNHCVDAPCVQVCPVGATFRSPEGFVLVDTQHCIGCGYCVQACPYGARFMNAGTHMADKCTWCYHRVSQGKDPACVTVCPTEARRFGDLRDPEDEISRIFSNNEWRELKPAMHTHCRSVYLNLPREVV